MTVAAQICPSCLGQMSFLLLSIAAMQSRGNSATYYANYPLTGMHCIFWPSHCRSCFCFGHLVRALCHATCVMKSLIRYLLRLTSYNAFRAAINDLTAAMIFAKLSLTKRNSFCSSWQNKKVWPKLLLPPALWMWSWVRYVPSKKSALPNFKGFVQVQEAQAVAECTDGA